MPLTAKAQYRSISHLITVSVLVSLSASIANGVDPNRRISQYGHTAWRVQDGAISSAGPIAQTMDGYMWLGTHEGLMRFDGVRFVRWQPPKGESLPGGPFTSLLGSRDGSLWIGTSRGLSRLKDGHLRTYMDPGDRVAVGLIMEDRSGAIWITRYNLHGRDGPLCRASGEGLHCFGKTDGIPVNYGLGLTEDSGGSLWFGSTILVRWRPGVAATTYFGDAPDNLSRRDVVVDVAAAPSGDLWAALDGTGPESGVRYYSGGKWTSYVVPGFDGSNTWSHTLFFDREGSLWVGTENDGIYRIHDGVADHYAMSDGLSGNSIEWFYEDREGNIWVCTEGGLDMFRDTPIISYTVHDGLSSADVRSVLALHDGSVWAANERGLDVLRKQGESTSVSARELAGQQVTTMLEDHTGAVWLSVADKLMRFQSGGFREVRRPDGRSFGGDGEVTAITEDTHRQIWVLANRGHFLGTVSNQIEEHALPSSILATSPRLLAADLNGGVWIASLRGVISHYRDGQFQTITLADKQNPVDIHDLFVAADDSVLLSTGHGLYRLKDGQTSVLNTENGLPCDSVYSAVFDNHHALWLYAQCGLLRIDSTELTKWLQISHGQIAVTKFDALAGAYPGLTTPYQPASSKAPDGRLWFNGTRMLQVVDPDHLFKNTVPPPLFIEDVVADHRTLPAASSLQVPALTRDLRIDYTALSFSVPQKIQFRYILEGHDKEWQDCGGRRQAFYTDLGPGKYRFRVVASTGAGVWNTSGAALNFAVLPAYYQTTWFRVACACLFVLIWYALYQLRVRRLQRQFEIGLVARVAERTRIARELHDTLLQSFQGLLLRFQSVSNLLPMRADVAKQRLDDAIEHTAKAIAEGRDAVHQLRSTIVATNDLASEISMLAHELDADHNDHTYPAFSIHVEGRPRSLRPIVRDEVYRIAAEALRNAFQHSAARRIEVELRYGEQELRLRARDDGRGIDPAIPAQNRPQGHWGLSGMRERAQLLGGNLQVWSEVNSGTEVELIIPASVAYTERGGWYRRLFSSRRAA